MQIPLLDLQAQYDSIRSEIKPAIEEVLESQYFIMGPTVSSFEKAVAYYCNTTHALGCASGSDALLLALMALDIGPGDFVLTTPFTFFATAGAISRVGATPVFIDIQPDSFNIDPEKVRGFLSGKDGRMVKMGIKTESVKAIIPVHSYGQMAEMDTLVELSNEYGISIIEDSAQAIGSGYKNIQAGNWGDFGCFSFFPSKNLGAYGDAGLITVKDEKLAEKTSVLRLHGAKPKYFHSMVGINSRLDALQAAILKVKLKHLDEWSDRRREIAMAYNHLFTESGLVTDLPVCSDSCTSECELSSDKIVIPKETTGAPVNSGRHIYHQYTIRVKDRDGLSEHLDTAGIGNAVYYPKPLHLQECFAELGYKKGDFPVAECATEQALSLPIYPEMDEEQIRYIVESVKEFLNK